jgi:hypothetical protein
MNDPGRLPPEVPTVQVNGQTWLVCPFRGAECCRVSLSLGEEWAADVIAVHMDLRHRAWR